MFLVNFLPEWIFHLGLAIGVVGLGVSYFLSVIPFVTQYKLALRIGSIVVIMVGLFFQGSLSNNDAWKLKVAEAEKKVLIAEANAAKANVVIVEKIVEKIKVVHSVKHTIERTIIDNTKDIDANCIVIPAAVDILNKAASARGERK